MDAHLSVFAFYPPVGIVAVGGSLGWEWHMKLLTIPRQSLPFGDWHGSCQTGCSCLPPREVWLLGAVHREMNQ